MSATKNPAMRQPPRQGAAIEDFTIAGKTGTAKKLVNGSYKGHSNYNVSFVGFAPSRTPKFTIIVVVDSPRGVPAYGGTVAAPIFHRIADAALRYYGVQKTINAPPPLIVERQQPGANAPLRDSSHVVCSAARNDVACSSTSARARANSSAANAAEVAVNAPSIACARSSFQRASARSPKLTAGPKPTPKRTSMTASARSVSPART